MKDIKALSTIGIDYPYWKILWDAEIEGYDTKYVLDAFSPSQIESKKWLVDILSFLIPNEELKIQLYGGWLGFPLIDLLSEHFNIKYLQNIELDEKALKIYRRLIEYKNLDRLVYDLKLIDVREVDGDYTPDSGKERKWKKICKCDFIVETKRLSKYNCVKFDFLELPLINLVINTSGEHMPDLPELIKNKTYQKQCLFAVQSNNMFHIPDHINCVNSEKELLEKCKFENVYYSGKTQMSNEYERYMVIGDYAKK